MPVAGRTVLVGYILLSTLALAVASKHAFADSERFERWSHFKDYGVPGTVHDPVNKAAIADGTCRLLAQKDSNFMWSDSSRTQRVINTLAAAPSTSQPSHFVLTAKKSLEEACFGPGDAPHSRPQYDLQAIGNAMQNWYHALCAPESDPSWKGAYDPAYQPQQVSLTFGFLCVASADMVKEDCPAKAFENFEADPDHFGKQLCHVFPWGHGTDFSVLGDAPKLAAKVVNLCGCTNPESGLNRIYL